MKISLIGMSGSGKSYWSTKLEQKGFKKFCCDDLIEKKLGKELKALGYSGIADVAKWMGQPYDKKYSQTSKKYLELEKEVMEEILKETNQIDNCIIDTTGSVIYLNQSILKKLSNATTVVYIQTPPSIKKHMYEQYCKDPKPVIWGTSFSKKLNQTNEEALKKCYAKLLKYRTNKYQKLADIYFNYYLLRNSNFTSDMFLEVTKKYDQI